GLSGEEALNGGRPDRGVLGGECAQKGVVFGPQDLEGRAFAGLFEGFDTDFHGAKINGGSGEDAERPKPVTFCHPAAREPSPGPGGRGQEECGERGGEARGRGVTGPETGREGGGGAPSGPQDADRQGDGPQGWRKGAQAPVTHGTMFA